MANAFDRRVVLHHARHRPVYGLWMLGELAAHGHRLSPGTHYPILARMEANGWLRSSGTNGVYARRDYRITAQGRRILAVLRAEIVELYDEVVRGKEPVHRRELAEGARRRTRAAQAKRRSS